MVILGCGYLGLALARASLAAGEPVAALTRNATRVSELRALGAAPVVVADIAARDWHAVLDPAGADIVNCVSPSSPGVEGYRHSFLAGLASVREWLAQSANCGSAPARSVLFTSSTAVYPQSDGGWVDEKTPVDVVMLSPAGAVLREAEEKWLALSPSLAQRAWVLRLGGLYGPGRHHLLDAIHAGQKSFPGGGNHWVNLIYRDDAVAAIQACHSARAEIGGGIFNVMDNNPVQKCDLISWLARQLGQDPTTLHFDTMDNPRSAHRRPAGGVLPDRRVSSLKLQKMLNWVPLCHSYQTGYGLMLS
jgi:nucleoside-diphosphate-sugar epimerase